MPLRLGLLGEMPADFVPATVEDQKACREAMRANSIEGEFGIKINYIGWCTSSKLRFNNLLDHEDEVGVELVAPNQGYVPAGHDRPWNCIKRGLQCLKLER